MAPFKPGQSGNPGGRPKGSVGLTRRIRDVLLIEQDGKTLADALAHVMIREAIANPAKMYLFIRDFIDRDEGRTDGKNVIDQTETPEDFAAKIREVKRQMEESVPAEAIMEEAEDAEVEPVEE